MPHRNARNNSVRSESIEQLLVPVLNASDCRFCLSPGRTESVKSRVGSTKKLLGTTSE